jgi:thiol-disulfide isomerase/thioredoxin
MKRIILPVVLMVWFVFIGNAQTPASAIDVLNGAYLQAAKENKNVFVIFHASWCGWCHKMDTSMNDPACKAYFDDNYVIRHLVVDESKDKLALENPGANELRIKYHGDGQGIPYWLVFDKEGKLLSDSKMRGKGEDADKGANTGCPASEKEVTFFVDILQKTSKLNSEQLEVIRKRFRKNECFAKT